MNWETLIQANHGKWREMIENEGAIWVGVQQSLLEEEPLVMFRARNSYHLSAIPITEMTVENVRRKLLS